MRPIDRWIILFAGYTQTHGQVTGLCRLWRDLHARYSSQRCVVHLATWKDDVADLAEWVWRFRPEERTLISRETSRPYKHQPVPHLVVVGYSFGGQTSVNFAGELDRRGLDVQRMVLCDPVYRYRCPLGWWRSMMPFSEIVVPANVDRVDWCRQTNPRFAFGRPGPFAQPAGHDVVAEEPDVTRIEAPIVLDVQHTYIDDSPVFHEMSDEAVRECFESQERSRI